MRNNLYQTAVHFFFIFGDVSLPVPGGGAIDLDTDAGLGCVDSIPFDKLSRRAGTVITVCIGVLQI